MALRSIGWVFLAHAEGWAYGDAPPAPKEPLSERPRDESEESESTSEEGQPGPPRV